MSVKFHSKIQHHQVLGQDLEYEGDHGVYIISCLVDGFMNIVRADTDNKKMKIINSYNLTNDLDLH